MVDFIIGPLLVFVLFGLWVFVQSTARSFAERHPELGPYREEGGGCCGCHEKKGCGEYEQNSCGVTELPTPALPLTGEGAR